MQYAYDASGRTVSVTPSGSYAALSTYDGSGQRVYVNENLTPKYLVYDAAGREIAEYSNFGLIRENIYRGGEMVATVEGSGVKYCLNDHAGSACALLDSTGNVAARHDYYTFGEEIGSSVGQRNTSQGYGGTDGTRTRFAGMERDTSGTDHAPFRRHDNKAGRWTSPDPYGGSQAVADPQSFNRYSYVGNDPVNAVDPPGLFTVCVQVKSRFLKQQAVIWHDDGQKHWVQRKLRTQFVQSHQGSDHPTSGHRFSWSAATRACRSDWALSSVPLFA